MCCPFTTLLDTDPQGLKGIDDNNLGTFLATR
jgi:hypothetical protein